MPPTARSSVAVAVWASPIVPVYVWDTRDGSDGAAVFGDGGSAKEAAHSTVSFVIHLFGGRELFFHYDDEILSRALKRFGG